MRMQLLIVAFCIILMRSLWSSSRHCASSIARVCVPTIARHHIPPQSTHIKTIQPAVQREPPKSPALLFIVSVIVRQLRAHSTLLYAVIRRDTACFAIDAAYAAPLTFYNVTYACRTMLVLHSIRL